MNEVWKDIAGYEGLYKVSNLGNVQSIATGKVLKKLPHSTGYYAVVLYKNRKPKRCILHRLVATAFIENPENKPTVNHKNGNKQDNSVTNLEWATHEENEQHAWKTGLKHQMNPKNNKLSTPIAQYSADGTLIKVFPSMNEAQRCGFSCPEICKCCKGRNKTHKGYIWKYA